LFVLRDKGYSLRAIATALNRSVCTVSSELKRNTVAGAYVPAKAHHKATVRRKASKFQGKKLVDNQLLLQFVEAELLKLQSPQAISGRLKTGQDGLPYVARDTIEEYIRSAHGRRLEYQLKVLKANQKPRRRSKRPNLESLQDRTYIDDRPSVISNRERVGDVEADFIVSGKNGNGYLLTVVDRKLRVGHIRQILPVTIANVEAAFLDIQKQFPELTSITTDNDILFRHHKRLAVLLGNITIYFCHAYHSWEKGTVENYNKQVRKYVKKGADISQYSKDYIEFVEARLNSRFMSVLGYATPEECLSTYRNSTRNTDKRKVPLTQD
jgi:IS30 family transposase